MDSTLFFGPHVCGIECDGPNGCLEGKSEHGRHKRIADAKQVCMTCPERVACSEWAVKTGQEFGVWGAMTERERRIAKKDYENRD